MNKKNFLCFMILTAVFLTSSQKAFSVSSLPPVNVKTEISVEEDDKVYTEAEIIKRVSFKNKFQKSGEAQITSFFKKYNRYSEKNNLKKLKEMYSDTFVNNDGFGKETVFKLLTTSADSYKNMKYTSEIKSIEINGKYATVRVHETATAETDNLKTKIKDIGIVASEVEFVDYLVKDGNNWKIQVSEIISEEVSMKYGEAKNMKVEITAPLCVPAGSEYEVSVTANTPDGSFALGSIVNEPIVFPQRESKDVFRAIKSEKLARVLTSNKEGHNEYTTVSIALTRAEVEPPAVNINMTGMAFAMKRINVVNLVPEKEAENGKNIQK